MEELKLIKNVKEYSGAIAITLVWGKIINSDFFVVVDAGELIKSVLLSFETLL